MCNFIVSNIFLSLTWILIHTYSIFIDFYDFQIEVRDLQKMEKIYKLSTIDSVVSLVYSNVGKCHRSKVESKLWELFYLRININSVVSPQLHMTKIVYVYWLF